MNVCMCVCTLAHTHCAVGSAHLRRCYSPCHSWCVTAVNLSNAMQNVGRVDEARALMETVLAARRQMFGDNSPAVGNALITLASMCVRLRGSPTPGSHAPRASVPVPVPHAVVRVSPSAVVLTDALLSCAWLAPWHLTRYTALAGACRWHLCRCCRLPAMRVCAALITLVPCHLRVSRRVSRVARL